MKAELVQAPAEAALLAPGGPLSLYAAGGLFCVWADGLDGAVATQPAHAAQQGAQGVFMGLAANDSHLWDMCGAAERGWRRRDMHEAWGLQAGCRPGLSQAAAGVVLMQTSFWGNPGHPGIRAFRWEQRRLC